MGARIVEALIGIGAFINKTTLNQEGALIEKGALLEVAPIAMGAFMN